MPSSTVLGRAGLRCGTGWTFLRWLNRLQPDHHINGDCNIDGLAHICTLFSLKNPRPNGGDMPTEQDAINVLNSAYERLKEFDWNDPIYCPKDGSSFDVIEAGSTGIHRAHYQGE
jgi:hypothetical protein